MSNNPGIFNFALHAEDLIFSPQAGDVEYSMYNKLGYDYSNYQRWQIFSEYQVTDTKIYFSIKINFILIL